MHSLPDSEVARLSSLLRPTWSRWIPHQPTPPQEAALLVPNREVLYGGAAGGGKSDWLLMAGLQYVDIPGYSAVLFRKKFQDLAKPGALMDRAGEWLANTAARWNEQKKLWRFPSGAVLAFGYLENLTDLRQHQGAEYQYVGFDELTQHEERHYKYLFSRLRRLRDSPIPIRMRAASNPGDVGHPWVFRRFFIEGPAKGRVFIPAKLEDNPYLDRDEYIQSLDELDPILKAQLLNGDWGAIDRSNAVVPEFTNELEAQIVRPIEVPTHFRPYVTCDTGRRDLNPVLYGFPDFLRGVLCIQAEDMLRDPTTGELGEVVGRRERDLWGTWKTGHEKEWSDKGALPPRRYADASLRMSVDLKADHAPGFGGVFNIVAKRDRDAAMNRTRQHLREGRIEIDPSCVTLRATLKGAIYNEKRTDFQRTPETGHADAFMALVYMDRMVDWRENPYPELELTWDGSLEEKRRSRWKLPPNPNKLVPLT